METYAVFGLLLWLGWRIRLQCGGPGFDPWVGKIPWRRTWQPIPVLAWRIPWTEEPGGVESMGLQRVKHDWPTKHSTAAAKSPQSCPTLCDPIHGSPPGSAVPGILQARTLEWVAISFSNAWKVKSESEVAQSCPTLCNPMDCSLPGSSVHGIFQARVLEWGATAFSTTRQ